jgi:3-dehydroquinate dehydratase
MPRLWALSAAARSYDLVVEEQIIDINDDARRLVWTVVAGAAGLTHYSAALQM